MAQDLITSAQTTSPQATGAGSADARQRAGRSGYAAGLLEGFSDALAQAQARSLQDQASQVQRTRAQAPGFDGSGAADARPNARDAAPGRDIEARDEERRRAEASEARADQLAGLQALALQASPLLQAQTPTVSPTEAPDPAPRNLALASDGQAGASQPDAGDPSLPTDVASSADAGPAADPAEGQPARPGVRTQDEAGAGTGSTSSSTGKEDALKSALVQAGLSQPGSAPAEARPAPAAQQAPSATAAAAQAAETLKAAPSSQTQAQAAPGSSVDPYASAASSPSATPTGVQAGPDAGGGANSGAGGANSDQAGSNGSGSGSSGQGGAQAAAGEAARQASAPPATFAAQAAASQAASAAQQGADAEAGSPGPARAAQAAGPAAPGALTAEPAETATAPGQPLSGPAAAASPAAGTSATAQAQGAQRPAQAAFDTLAGLAANITRRLEGRMTRFDVALTPEGLGRVDVSVEIGPDGVIAARLAFDNPAAAAELRGRAQELHRLLQDAGFDTSGGLSFADSGAGQNQNQGFGQEARSGRGQPAFLGGLDLADRADEAALAQAAYLQNRSAAGLDIRI